MTKKGQKFQKYDLEFINETSEFKKKDLNSETSREFTIPEETLMTWIYKNKHHNHYGIVNTRKE